jgi:nitrogen fixation/metabolism regulation signal transduction histidine kinase
MKLRTKYLLFVTLLHLVTLVLSYFIFRDNKLIFLFSEIIILVSIVISWQLYKELIQPLQMLMQGVEAIKDRDFNVKFIETGKYEMDQLISVYNQMMDQLRVERIKGEEQHFFLAKLIHTSPTGILVLDHDEKIHQVNPKGVSFLGVGEKEVLQKSLADLSIPLLQEIRHLKSGESKTITINGVTTYKLQKSHFIDQGFPRHFVMIEELTTEILAAEKKAYGKVIRMMAHEVSNTIGPVNSILQSTLASQNLWQENNNSLQHALQVAINRNGNLNLFMRNFAEVVRLPEPAKTKTDLHSLLKNVTALMELNKGEREIEFRYQLAEGPLYIMADVQQIEQALINIIKNAMEAIEEKGTICFSTTHSPKKLSITDTGRGISKEQSEQLFSPFFSTKKDGQGIGLTLVKEILLNHQFEFSLKTLSEGITEFLLRMK